VILPLRGLWPLDLFLCPFAFLVVMARFFFSSFGAGFPCFLAPGERDLPCWSTAALMPWPGKEGPSVAGLDFWLTSPQLRLGSAATQRGDGGEGGDVIANRVQARRSKNAAFSCSWWRGDQDAHGLFAIGDFRFFHDFNGARVLDRGGSVRKKGGWDFAGVRRAVGRRWGPSYSMENTPL